MLALDFDAFMSQLRLLQQKETIAEVLAEPFARSLLAAAVGLLFVVLLLVGPKKKEEKSELDKALQGQVLCCPQIERFLPSLPLPGPRSLCPRATSAEGRALRCAQLWLHASAFQAVAASTSASLLQRFILPLPPALNPPCCSITLLVCTCRQAQAGRAEGLHPRRGGQAHHRGRPLAHPEEQEQGQRPLHGGQQAGAVCGAGRCTWRGGLRPV